MFSELRGGCQGLGVSSTAAVSDNGPGPDPDSDPGPDAGVVVCIIRLQPTGVRAVNSFYSS